MKITSGLNYFRELSPLVLALFLCLNACSKGDDQATKHAKESFTNVKNYSKSNQEKAPGLIIFNNSYKDSKCGEIDGSAYCSLDKKIYLEKNQLNSFSNINPIAIDLIVAHEYAHAMQDAYGFGRKYTVLNELQADCLAGAFLSENFKTPNDLLQKALLVAWSSGDFEWQYADHHGFPHQRLQAFLAGTASSQQSKKEGILVCQDLF